MAESGSQLTRGEAEAMVMRCTRRIGRFRAVNDEDAEDILGADQFAKLKADPIRRHGPIPQTVYPWNVVDHLLLREPTDG